MLKPIENITDMIAWAEEVNLLVTTNTKRVWELQDVWGRSIYGILKRIINSLIVLVAFIFWSISFPRRGGNPVFF